ncbi:MAG: YdbH domain-containing protein [Rhodospirillales bacterium]
MKRKLFTAAAFVILLAAAAAYWRLTIAEAGVRYGLSAANIDDARFTVTELTPFRLTLSDIRVGKELSAKTAEIVFDIANLSERPVTRLVLRGVRADATVDGPLRRRLMPSGGTQEPLSKEKIGQILGALPALEVHDARLTVAAEGRVLIVSGSLKAKREGMDKVAGTLVVDVEQAKPGKDAKTASFVLPKVAVRSAFTVDREVLAFDGGVSAARHLSAKAKGRHRLIDGTGNADINLDLVRFGPGGPLLTHLLSNSTGMNIKAGTMAGEARVSWNDKGIAGTASLKIDGLEMSDETTGVDIEGLSAEINVDRFVPLRTPPGQVIRIRRVAAGTDLTDLTLRFSLESEAASAYPLLRVEDFDAGFIGGTFNVRPTVLDPAGKENNAVIDLANVDLAALFALIGVDGVSGEGRLGGVIPVRQVAAAVGITGGKIAAAGPGTLRIRSAAVNRALAQGGKDVALMLSALANFRYQVLTVEVDKELQGEGRILLKTRGHNPAVLDGRPFAININMSGNVDRIAAVIAQALNLPAALVRSIVPKAE